MLDEEGKVMLDVDNMRFTSLNNKQEPSSSSGDQTGKAYSSPFARLIWRPDIRTLNKDQMQEVLSSSQDQARAFPQLSKIFDLVGHANPNLRVLEINASSDADVAQAVLRMLVGSNDIKRYREFVATDVSQAQLASVAISTSEFRDVNYCILDISEGLSQQGFQPGLYDIVLGSNVVHTPQALENLGKLVRPGGYLVQIEATNKVNCHRGLPGVGFDPVGEVFDPAHQSTVSIHTLLAPVQQQIMGCGTVHFLHGAKGAPALLYQFARGIEKCGLNTRVSLLDDAPSVISPNSRVVAFLDDENLLFGADQHRLEVIQHLATNTASIILHFTDERCVWYCSYV